MRSRSFFRVCLVLSVIYLGSSQTAFAHGTVGKRFIPTLFAIEDPFVADELSLLVGFIEEPSEGGEPAIDETEVELEYSKRITPHFALSIGGEFADLNPDGESREQGVGNLELGARYQFIDWAEWEAVASINFEAEIGRTGQERVEADNFSTLSPSILYGIGAGRLPEPLRYLRPLALTGIVGANFPTNSRSGGEPNPITLTWGFSVQYSLSYLDAFVKDIGLPPILDRFTPVVEFDLESCIDRDSDCEGGTTGTVNPGLVWIGSKFEVGLAARVPINSRSGDDVGVFGLFHIFIDDLFPNSIGKPIFSRP